jgi:hypothetical protein
MSTFDYTSRDYFSIKEDLLARAESVLPEWTSRDASDFGMLLVDLWAYMGDVLHYYIDRAAQEAFLPTATQRSSILAIASLLDYTPTGRTPATASITLNATNSAATDASPILIPRYTRFIANPLISGADDVVFTSNRPIAFNESGTDIENYTTYAKSANALVTLTEGEIFTQSFTSDGLAGQRFTLNKTGVVRPSVSVTVSEGAGGTTVDYSLVDRFIDATNTDNVFSITLNSDDSSTLVFGNGVYGKIPTVNATVSVYYRRSRGSAGNVDANTITAFESLTNTLGPPYDGIVITPNTVKASGGTNSESINSLQLNIPASFRSQDRAVSIQDYRDLTLRIPGISKSTANVVSGSTAKTGYITNKALTSNVATLTTGAAHGLTVGETIAVFDVDDTFDGTFTVKTGSSGTTLLYDLVSASVASASVSSVASYRNAQIKIYALSDQAVYDGTLVTSPTTSPLLLDNDYRDSIYSYIEPRQMVGVNTVVMPSVALTSAKVTITLNVLNTYVQQSVIDLVTTAIKSLLSFDSVTFGQTISLGTLYRAIIDIDGVDYVTVDRFTTGSSAVIDTIGLTPVVKGVQAATDSLLLLSELVITASGGVV